MFIVDSLCLSLPCRELNSQTFKAAWSSESWLCGGQWCLIFVIFLHARILSHTNSHTNIRYDDNDDEFTGWSLRNLEGLRQNCWKLEFILKFVFGDSNVLVMMIMMSEPSWEHIRYHCRAINNQKRWFTGKHLWEQRSKVEMSRFLRSETAAAKLCNFGDSKQKTYLRNKKISELVWIRI